MEPQEIAKKVSVILSQATIHNTLFYNNPQHPIAKSRPGPLVVDNPSEFVITDEEINLLKTLRNSLDPSEQALMASIMKLMVQSAYASYAVTYLAKYCNVDQAIESLVEKMALNPSSIRALHAMGNLLRYDHTLFTDQQLDSLPKMLSNQLTQLISPDLAKLLRASVIQNPPDEFICHREVRGLIERIQQQTQRIQYIRLRSQLLEGANYQVNQDKETLEKELTRFGFSAKLTTSLRHAEKEYLGAASEFDYKTCVDHVRSFFEGLLRETATKIAAKRNESVDVEHANRVREYLRESLFLSDRLHKLCEAFYQFASDEGSHELSSPREVARIVRNIGIELGLLTVERLAKYSLDK